MRRVQRLVALVCLVILITGLASGTLPVAVLDYLEPLDPIFGALPSLILRAYVDAVLQPPFISIRSPRAPPLV
jgi:hypothetical protein